MSNHADRNLPANLGLEGSPLLGMWQAICLIEHRRRPSVREVVVQFTGATAQNSRSQKQAGR
jgi:hypothetical protein